MKLRIKGNSLRLRVSQGEMATLLAEGRIAETIRFGAAADAKLTYALEVRDSSDEIGVEYGEQTVSVAISTEAARRWAAGNDVGIYGSAEGGEEPLALLVEKDFACLDGDEARDPDAFPHPGAGAVC